MKHIIESDIQERIDCKIMEQTSDSVCDSCFHTCDQTWWQIMGEITYPIRIKLLETLEVEMLNEIEQ